MDSANREKYIVVLSTLFHLYSPLNHEFLSFLPFVGTFGDIFKTPAYFLEHRFSYLSILECARYLEAWVSYVFVQLSAVLSFCESIVLPYVGCVAVSSLFPVTQLFLCCESYVRKPECTLVGILIWDY